MNPHIEKLIRLLRADAADKRSAAGYDGRMDDGGASIMEMQATFYELGASGEVPDEWAKYEVQLDPEYEQYQRLKSKFGGR